MEMRQLIAVGLDVTDVVLTVVVVFIVLVQNSGVTVGGQLRRLERKETVVALRLEEFDKKGLLVRLNRVPGATILLTLCAVLVTLNNNKSRVARLLVHSDTLRGTGLDLDHRVNFVLVH